MRFLLKPPIPAKETITNLYHITIIGYGNEKVIADKLETYRGTIYFYKKGEIIFASPVIYTIITNVEKL